jgi:hypothetical protein
VNARYILPLVLLAAVGCKGGSNLAVKQEPTYDLVLKLREGQTYAYTLSKVGKEENDTASFDMLYKVQDVTPEATTLEMTFERLEMNGADMTPLMKQVAGDVAMQLKLSDKAETLDHKWTGGNEQFLSMVGNMGGSLLSLPENPVKVGDKWSGNIGAEEDGLLVEFELVSVQGNTAEIKATTKQESTVKLAEPIQIQLDITNGMVISQKFVGELGDLGEGTYELKQTTLPQ